jgi:hypothetical protein
LGEDGNVFPDSLSEYPFEGSEGSGFFAGFFSPPQAAQAAMPLPGIIGHRSFRPSMLSELN